MPKPPLDPLISAPDSNDDQRHQSLDRREIVHALTPVPSPDYRRGVSALRIWPINSNAALKVGI